MSDNTGIFTVEAVDSTARVVWESSFEPLDPVMEQQLAESLTRRWPSPTSSA